MLVKVYGTLTLPANFRFCQVIYTPVKGKWLFFSLQSLKSGGNPKSRDTEEKDGVCVCVGGGGGGGGGLSDRESECQKVKVSLCSRTRRYIWVCCLSVQEYRILKSI